MSPLYGVCMAQDDFDQLLSELDGIQASPLRPWNRGLAAPVSGAVLEVWTCVEKGQAV